MAVHKVTTGFSYNHVPHTQPKIEHETNVVQTKAGLWYAVCTCGKRSRFFVGKVTAESVAENHVK